MALLAEQALPQLGFLCTEVAKRIQKGGRTYFTGEGTSGRLGIVDAAETPPTYGVEDKIFDVIAGATALQNEVENAGDYKNAGWEYYRSLVLTARM